jgi:tetratricopeptide (TPR) repeat protein
MKKSLLLIVLLVLALAAGCTSNQPEVAATTPPTQSPVDLFENGNVSMTQNDFAGAVEQFTEAISVDSEYGEAYSYLALAELWGGLPGDEALAHAGRGAELAPDNAFSQAVLAFAQLDGHILLNAVGTADHAYQLDPEDPFVVMVFALALTSNYEYERAWETLRQAYTDHPDSPEVHLALGFYFSSTGDFGRAMAAYDRAVELDPEFAVWHFYQAQFYLLVERYNQADVAFRTLQDLAPDYLPGLVLKAQLEIVRSEITAAEQTLNQLEVFSDDWIITDFLHGDLAFIGGNYDAAVEYYSLARDKTADTFLFDLKLAEVYLQQSDCSKAQTVIDEFGVNYPDHVDPFYLKGNLHLCFGDPSAALAEFTEALRIDPFNQAAYLGMAQAYQMLGESGLVQDVMLEALTLEPASSQVHFIFGELLAQQNELSAAEAEIRTGLNQNGYDVDGYNLLTTVLLARFRLEEALEVVEEGLDLNPDHPITQQLYASLLVLNDRAEEAIPFLEKALEMDPHNGELLLYTSLALRDVGDFEGAATSLTTYISIQEEQGTGTERLDNARLLLETLRDGYALTQEAGLALIADSLSRVVGYVPEIHFENNSAQETNLVVELPVSLNQLNSESYLVDLVAASVVSAEVLPRVAPTVEGGLEIRVNYGGTELFLARLAIEDIKIFAGLLLTHEELIDRMVFDLADSSVQRGSIDQILREVADLRDLDLDEIPDYEIISREVVGGYFMDDFDQEYIDTLGNEYAAMALLGVLPEDTNPGELVMDFLSTNVAGFYNPRQGKIYIVADDRLTSSDQLTIVHESEHALADQEFNLGSIRSRTTDSDRYQAATALIEGDAELLSDQYLYEIIPDIGWWSDLSDSESGDSEMDVEYPSYLINMALFPYFYGLDFVSFLYDQGGWRQVNNAMWDPPSSSEQIMHPQRYLDDDNPRRVYLEDPSDELGRTWELVDEDVMGEYGVFLTLSEYFGRAAARPAAEGWGGDRYILLERGDDLILAWRIGWDNPAEAQEFWESLTIAMFHRDKYHEVVDDFGLPATKRVWSSEDGYLVMSLIDDQVTIVIGDELDDLEVVLGSLD